MPQSSQNSHESGESFVSPGPPEEEYVYRSMCYTAWKVALEMAHYCCVDLRPQIEQVHVRRRRIAKDTPTSLGVAFFSESMLELRDIIGAEK